jgi:hypothetical protein
MHNICQTRAEKNDKKLCQKNKWDIIGTDGLMLCFAVIWQNGGTYEENWNVDQWW